MTSAGVLMAIGGAEDKTGGKTVLTRFTELAGGPTARIAVIGTASEIGAAVLNRYRILFAGLGVHDVVGLDPQSREQASADAAVGPLERATGVFLTGGNQLRLGTILAGTALGSAVVAAHRRGAVIGGTSAGASALSEHMMSFGAPGATPKNRMSQLSAGLGLLPGVIVDQHFTQRNRIGRLLSLVAASPGQLGIGVDEDTAAVIAGKELEVIGRGVVTVVDGSGLTSNVATARRGTPLLVSGAVLHTLPAGARFDLAGRRLLASYGEPAAWRQPGAREAAE